MKIAIVFLILAGAIITIIISKSGNSNYLDKNGKTTTGKVIDVFYRGKLPFCKFNYTVKNKSFTKIQDLPKHFAKKVLNKTYVVQYDETNPTNAIIQLKKEVN